MRAVRQHLLHFASEHGRHSGDPALEHGGERAKHSVKTEKQQTANEVDRKTRRPGFPVKLKAPTEPENHGRKQRPLVPITQRPVKGLAPAHGMVKRSRRIKNLRREEQPKQSRNQENLRNGSPLASPTRSGLVIVTCTRTDHAASLDPAASGVKSPLDAGNLLASA